MKPINYNKESCNPISSNCVIWQGPDIECISLCKGDTVTDVVYKLATELCDLIETFNINDYDLTCLNLGDCGPDNFQKLIQLLIDKICELDNNVPVEPGTSIEGCPDCVVDIAECFYFQNEQGDTVTTMQLTSYVNTIGNKLCSIIGQIETINKILENHENRIQFLEQEETPEVELPDVTPICVSESIPTPMDQVLTSLESLFCQYTEALGTTIQLTGSLTQDCTKNGESLNGGMIPEYNLNASTVGENLSNIWRTICDLRDTVRKVLDNCCSTACDSIDVILTASRPNDNQLLLYINGVVPSPFIECAATTQFTITHSTGSFQVSTSILAFLNNSSGFSIDLTPHNVSPSSDLTISAQACFQDGLGDDASQCSFPLTYTLVNETFCPNVSLGATFDNITYGITWSSNAAAVVTLELSLGGNVVETAVEVFTNSEIRNGVFTSNLQSEQTYDVNITVVSGSETLECGTYQVSTSAAPCLTVTSASAEITLA